MGVGVSCFAFLQLDVPLTIGRFGVFLVLLVCGIAIAYSLFLLLTSTAVWFKRNQSLYELWWLFTSLMRYPREIFVGPLAYPLGWFFTYVIPILLVVNLPARTLVKLFDEPVLIAFTLAVAVI